MRKLWILIFLAGATMAKAQVAVSYITPEEAVAALVGDGIEVSNITFTGLPEQLGLMTGAEGTTFPIGEGVLLSSADATNVDPVNGANTDIFTGVSGDPDLLDVANSVPGMIGQNFSVSSVNDLAILEFDFVPSGDSLKFNYSFGSDEYLEWVNSSFNDVFAFFLSGPGITGPYDAPAGFPDGAINIAFVPDTDPILPITISSVNTTLNTEYYIDNVNNVGFAQDGYTVTMVAESQVICGETYHIKLAIADGSDTALESIVVLEAGSFASNAVSISSGVDNPPPFLSSNEVYEGCVDGYFTIYPPLNLLEADTIELNVFGTAENIIDFEEIPSSVIFEPGSDPIIIPLIPLYDQLDEGTETITLQYTYYNTCGDLDTASASIDIIDYKDMQLEIEDQFICPGADITVNGTPAFGQSPFDYAWTSGGTNSSEGYASGDAGDYSVTVTDFCDREITRSFTVVEPSEIVWEEEEDQYCVGQNTEDLVEGGAMPYEFLYPADSLELVNTLGQNFGANYAGEYEVIIIDQCDQSHVFFLNYIVCDTHIPNVFSPDVTAGQNDFFYIDGLVGFPQSKLYVYDRWGVKIYESDNYKNNWDGDGAPEGTYYYVFERSDGHKFSGHVMIVR
ncbi:MAG: gliding motility-associated C-terminal domain-containing protein [Flavobacteriales bacterium]|nr:gliding motility-associated C-terminal domain-containing protein [Flavobacteriales bacterium]